MAIRKRTWGEGKEGFEASISVRGKKKRKLFQTKGEAKAWVFEEQRKLKAGTYLAETVKATIASLQPEFEEYLAQRSRANEITDETASDYISKFKHYVVGGHLMRRRSNRNLPETFPHGIGAFKIAEVTEHVVEELLRSLLAFGLSKKTVREMKLTMSVFFEFARFKRYVTHNPTKGIAVKSLKAKGKRKIHVPSKKLLNLMIARAREPFATMIRLAMLAGLRKGEHRALHWSDIDFANNRIYVTKSLRDSNKMARPKTEAGNRFVPMSSALTKMLGDLRSTTQFNAENDPVFPNGKGNALDAAMISKLWNRLYNETIASWPVGEKVPPRPRWHDLRHFCVSAWVEAGMQPKAVQTFIGHETIDMTMRIYAHVFDDAEFKREMDQIAGELLGSPKTPGTSAAHSKHRVVRAARNSR